MQHHKEHILIIDDDDVTLRLAAHIFQKAGFEVTTAASGAEGLHLVESVNPDLVISDVMMPDMSGLEVCQYLRNNPATAWTPIILLSAKSTVEDKLQGFEVGADDYVGKPVSHKELLARANALLVRARRTHQPNARIIAAVGVKGGVGVTTTLVNVAVQLASQGSNPILAELRTTRGTLGHNLAMSPAEDLGGLLLDDPAKIKTIDVLRRVTRHKTGVRALLGPRQVGDYQLTEAHTHLVLEALKDQTDYLLLDLPGVTGGGVQLALESSDQILLVLEPEAISIECARADLEILRQLGLFDRTALLVVTRARSSNLIAPKDIEQRLGVTVLGVLPPSPEVFYLAASLANPVVLSKPDSLAATSLLKLTDALLERLPVGGVSARPPG